jgi:hypothetical protein
MQRGVYIACHQGLGDHLACAGIYRELAMEYECVIVPVLKKYSNELLRMTSDLPQIHLAKYSNRFWESQMLAHRNQFSRSEIFDILNLGYYGVDFFKNPKMRVDSNFYAQAGLNLDLRWSNFKYSRNSYKENLLYNLLIPEDTRDYIFLHEDRTRGYVIDRSLLPSEFKIITPDTKLKNYSFFDYIKVIENAKQIHCIESSFSAFVDNTLIDSTKFIHRYARPEAREDFKHEFTYRAGWNVIL